VNTNEENKYKRTREAGVMLDPVMDIDVGQVEDTRLVVSTKDASNRVGDIPTESWSKVVVVADDLTHLLKRDVAAVAWQDACKTSNETMSSESQCSMHHGGEAPEWNITVVGKRVQRRAGAPTVLVSWGGILWPTPSADGDLPWRLPGGDKVVKRETEVGLEDEEDLDEVGEVCPAGGGSATEPVDNSGDHGGGRRERGKVGE
jgi:hypothetical protein